jgi:hypothetical protein
MAQAIRARRALSGTAKGATIPIVPHFQMPPSAWGRQFLPLSFLPFGVAFFAPPFLRALLGLAGLVAGGPVGGSSGGAATADRGAACRSAGAGCVSLDMDCPTDASIESGCGATG